MMTDFAMQVATAQAVTALSVSTGFVDQQSSYDAGEGASLLARIRITTAFKRDNATAGTLRFAIAGTDGTWGLAALGTDGVVYGATADLTVQSELALDPLTSMLPLNGEIFIRLAPASSPELRAAQIPFAAYTGLAGLKPGTLTASAGRRYLGAVFLPSAGLTITGGAVTIDFIRDTGTFAKTYPKSYNHGIA